MITPCRARNVISLILLAGPWRTRMCVQWSPHAHGRKSLIQQHHDKFTLRTITISSTTHTGGAP
jgi:hypothetical protein